jgi:hypothetical protein
MPRPHKDLNDNSIVKVKARFLRKNSSCHLLEGQYDLQAPGLTFQGKTVARSLDNAQSTMYDVVLDILPDQVFTLAATSMQYIGQVAPLDTSGVSVEEATSNMDTGSVTDEDSSDDDLLEDAIQEGEGSHEDGNDDDSDPGTWRRREVFVDERVASAQGYARDRARINLAHPETASPMGFFMRFLPVDHIKADVIPCINEHAHDVLTNWKDLTFSEYLTWLGLMLNMMIWKNSNTKAYWGLTKIKSFISVDFTMHMSYKRFKEIIAMHVFVVPDGAK